MNSFFIDGLVGSVTKKDNHTLISFCHKVSWEDKKESVLKWEDNWFTAVFFGKAAGAIEGKVKVGQHIVVEGSLSVFPKTGPDQKIRLHGKSFHIVDRHKGES